MQLDPPFRDFSLVSWALVLSIGVVSCAATGRLSVHAVPDTPSYLTYPLNDLDAALRSIRTPGYPCLLAIIRRITGSVELMPLVHLFLMFISAACLSRELRHWEMPWMVRWSAAWSVGFGCTMTDQVGELATDAPAAAVGVLTITALLAWGRRSNKVVQWLLVVLACTAAISLRPAYLFLPVWVGVAGWLLLRLQSFPLSIATMRAVCLTVCTTLPVVAWMLLRFFAVNDFGVIPFGGQNLTGVLIQIVSDDQLRALPGTSGQLATEIISERNQWVAQRGWFDGAEMEYMTWENRWHDATYHVVFPVFERRFPNDNVASHRAVQVFNRNIVLAYPDRYLVWLAKAARRAAWVIAADIVMHPIALLLIVLAITAVLLRTATGRGHRDHP